MDKSVANDVSQVIRTEKQRRAALLANEEPDVASDQWISFDEPLANELCLLLLVAIRHQFERQLVLIAARVTPDGKAMDRKEYQQNVKDQRERLRREKGEWKNIIDKLKLKKDSSMETLRLLANCYKHNPLRQPDKDLLKHLKLDENLNYMPLPESDRFWAGLAASVGLPEKADSCDIAERFLYLTYQFLEDVRKESALSPLTGRMDFRDRFGY